MRDADSPSAASTPSAEPAGPKTARWVGLAFLALVMLTFVAAQWFARGGPPVQWSYDLDEAFKVARAEDRRVFLVLFEPGCPVTARNDREIFGTRNARERLARAVCCRIELKLQDPLRRKYATEGLPVALVMKPDGTVLRSQVGPLEERSFHTLATQIDTR